MKNVMLVLAGLLGSPFVTGINQAAAQDWPQWRGPHRDNKVTGFAAPKVWPKELTKKWAVPVGKGESSPIMKDNKIYVFSREGNNEVTLCLDASSGKELWRDKYEAVKVQGPASGYPGPRSTPAVSDGKVCTLGVGGVISCLDAANGNVIWRKDPKYAKPVPQFYTATSPMIVNGLCIVFQKGLTAFDLSSGQEKWNWAGAGAPYGSPVLMSVDGTKMVVTPASGMLAGVELSNGKLLWKTAIGSGPRDYASNYSTPLVDKDMVYYSISGGRKGGGSFIALKIAKADGGFKASEVWKKPYAATDYCAPLLKDGMIFGVNSGLSYFCMDATTGNKLWTDSAKRGKCGSILAAGQVLLSLTSDEELVAFTPSAKGFSELAKYRVAESETWCEPIVAGNRIYVKDKKGELILWTIN